MPPPVSEDEASESSIEEVVEAPVKKTAIKKPPKGNDKPSEDPAKDGEVGDEDVDPEEGDEPEEGEFVVEAIKSHLVTNGEIHYQVKWEGWEKRTDMTWEPEDNLLGSADDILNTYLKSVGGREAILGEDAKKKEPKAKKRSRAATATSTPESKKARKAHPASTTPPASLRNTEFVPPSGSWEDAVQTIDACEGTDGKVMVFLQWASGHKTQHSLDQVYKRCPQKMLKFYESHLIFKKAGTAVGVKAEAES